MALCSNRHYMFSFNPCAKSELKCLVFGSQEPNWYNSGLIELIITVNNNNKLKIIHFYK